MYLGYYVRNLHKLSRGIPLNSEWFSVVVRSSCHRYGMAKKYYIKRQGLSS
jgi:hypothetical protein